VCPAFQLLLLVQAVSGLPVWQQVRTCYEKAEELQEKRRQQQLQQRQQQTQAVANPLSREGPQGYHLRATPRKTYK
jgi:hypothetical protein